MIQIVINKTKNSLLNSEDLQKKLNNKKSSNHNPWQVCCGHDLVEILSISLRKLLGTNKASDIEANKLESSLRIGYEKAYFWETELYKNICIWKKNNLSFEVLRNRR